MSFLSRWFRKTPSLSPPPTPALRPASPAKAGTAPSRSDAADRARAAAAEEASLQAALDAGDAKVLARLVVAGTSTKLRQAAAQAIDDPELLRQLLREVRGGNDKNVYKILAAKRDALSGQLRQQAQLRAEIDAAATALERHSRRAYDIGYPSTLVEFETRWDAVAEQADATTRDQVQQWIGRSRDVIAEHRRLVAEQASREQAAAEAAVEAERLRQQQEQASTAAAAEQAQALKEQQRARAEQQAAAQDAVHQLGELIRKARGALSGGSTARAATMRRTIEEKLAGAPPLPAHLASQLQLLDAQLAELKDWKRFSVAPKRAELIEEMESLIGIPLDPPALAERIKGLQEEWRGLSKDSGENIEADWQRFHDAGQKAYQPCSEYFAAQALVREENLRRREALLSRLTAYEAAQDWERPDWRGVIGSLRETKQEWRGFSAVDRAAGKRQQDAFDALTARLQGRVDAEYARNLKQKESLIERARALLASDDNRKAIDAIKELQQQWRTVGPVPREADQRLWGEFREHCDGVFQKRQQEFASYTAGLDSNKAQALALCEQLEAIAALEGPELLERAATRAELRKAFEALGEFPRADTRELRNRFERALERCEAALKRQQARDAERSWDDLFEAADRVRAYRLAVARKLDTAQLDALKAAAETHIASVPRWPRDGLDAVRKALAGERSDDLAANEAALRLLCIRAEIRADRPTPPEDQALRREHQLQQLVKRMGKGARTGETHLDGLAIEWVGVGPVEETAYQPLQQRFRSCRS